MKRKSKAKGDKVKFPHSVSLYKFIRLILGDNIPDCQIAGRWQMDIKNFHEFKTGVYPVPRLEKLEQLARVLGINKHLVFQVAGGASAAKVFELIKKNDLAGQTRLLSRQQDEARESLVKSERRYRLLFKHANDAIIIADTKTGIILDGNQQAELLLGRPRAELVGMNRTEFHPPSKQKFYDQHFKKHVKHGKVVDFHKTEIMRKDGSVVPVHISASVMELDGREVIQGIFRQAGPLP